MPPMRTARKSTTIRARERRLCPNQGVSMSRYLLHCYKNKIKPLYREYVEAPDRCPSIWRVREDLAFVRDNYLPVLEFEVEMTPKLADFAKIEDALNMLGSRFLPKDVRQKALALLQAFENKAWGKPLASSSGSSTPTLSGFRYPPEDHPIYGKGRIMAGILKGTGPKGNTVYEIADRCTTRHYAEYGHNGLQPGFWHPFRIGLVLHGGHQQLRHGISGDENRGAYSIVISGKSEYQDVDVDEGNIVYYSAQGGGKKGARKNADSKGNQALTASIRTGRPVRVFRSAGFHGGTGKYAPSNGIRYDGLYLCVSKEQRRNKQGSHYERFKMVRMERSDQPDLDVLVRQFPTAQQKADYVKVYDGY